MSGGVRADRRDRPADAVRTESSGVVEPLNRTRDRPLVESTRALATLERLLAIPAADLEAALTSACDLVAEALGADKVDAFLHDPTRATLVAFGSSTQPLSALQRKSGLDVLPIANG